MTERIKETIKVVISTAFLVFGIWEITVPFEEADLIQLTDLIFSILNGIIGTPLGLLALGFGAFVGYPAVRNLLKAK